MILLVRHAIAVPRARWEGDDDLRPLTDRGERQASALVEQLAATPVDRVLTSAAVRCAATVAPLATNREVTVEVTRRLAEGHGREALDLVLETVGHVAMCTHGDVIDEVLGGVVSAGWPVPAERKAAKGSTWLLSPHGPCIYLASPV